MSITVVQNEVKFTDGSRIYYKIDAKGNVRRVIDYAACDGYPAEYVDNAGKYYYLKILKNYRDLAKAVYMNLEYLCNMATDTYDIKLERELCNRFTSSLYGHQSYVFFTVIYLAMVDYEADKKRPNWRGKLMVLDSCKAVLIDNLSYELAAELYKKTNDTDNI